MLKFLPTRPSVGAKLLHGFTRSVGYALVAVVLMAAPARADDQYDTTEAAAVAAAAAALAYQSSSDADYALALSALWAAANNASFADSNYMSAKGQSDFAQVNLSRAQSSYDNALSKSDVAQSNLDQAQGQLGFDQRSLADLQNRASLFQGLTQIAQTQYSNAISACTATLGCDPNSDPAVQRYLSAAISTSTAYNDTQSATHYMLGQVYTDNSKVSSATLAAADATNAVLRAQSDLSVAQAAVQSASDALTFDLSQSALAHNVFQSAQQLIGAAFSADRTAQYNYISTQSSADAAVSADMAFDLIETVPEPASMTLLALGMVGLFAARRRRRDSRQSQPYRLFSSICHAD